MEDTEVRTTPITTGFIAICQCGNIVGALDYTRTDLADVGKILGQWLHDGCTIQPRFDSHWTVKVTPCQCVEGKQLPLLHAVRVAKHPDHEGQTLFRLFYGNDLRHNLFIDDDLADAFERCMGK